MVEELSPELFIYELYDSSGPYYLDNMRDEMESFGYCDGSRLAVRPKSDLYALMVIWKDGSKCWFHVDKKQLEDITKHSSKTFS